MIAVGLNETKKVTLKAHEGLDNKPTFELKTLSARSFSQVLKEANSINDDGKTIDEYNSSFVRIVSSGVVGYEDISQADALLDLMTFSALSELVSAIIEFNSLSKTTTKN